MAICTAQDSSVSSCVQAVLASWQQHAGCGVLLLLLQVEKQCKCLINLANLYEIQVGAAAVDGVVGSNGVCLQLEVFSHSRGRREQLTALRICTSSSCSQET
jgi:hypothetical protein